MSHPIRIFKVGPDYSIGRMRSELAQARANGRIVTVLDKRLASYEVEIVFTDQKYTPPVEEPKPAKKATKKRASKKKATKKKAAAKKATPRKKAPDA